MMIEAGIEPHVARHTILEGMYEWTRRALDMHRLQKERLTSK